MGLLRHYCIVVNAVLVESEKLTISGVFTPNTLLVQPELQGYFRKSDIRAAKLFLVPGLSLPGFALRVRWSCPSRDNVVATLCVSWRCVGQRPHLDEEGGPVSEHRSRSSWSTGFPESMVQAQTLDNIQWSCTILPNTVN